MSAAAWCSVAFWAVAIPSVVVLVRSAWLDRLLGGPTDD